MIIKTWRNPYHTGFSPTKPREIEIKPGLTVLVGCNGAGKTTLLKNIHEHCQNNNIPYLHYDNLHDGGNKAIADSIRSGDLEHGASLFCSSEGESIKINISVKSSEYKEFIQNGFINNREYRLKRAFAGINSNIIDVIECKDRVFLFDAVDSGLSVDSVVEIKDLFELMIDDNKNTDKNIYIIIAANEYELARNTDCFDVNTGKYIRFSDYEEYRTFILKSRSAKEKRIIQQAEWRKKEKIKELARYEKVKEKQAKLLQKHKKKYEGKESPKYDWELRKIENLTKEFLRNARFISEENIAKD